jgi:serine protease
VLQNTIVRGDLSKDTYEFFQGTSMATPHVAAAAALVMATGVTNPEDVEAALFDSARKVHGRTGRDDKYGHGVLDAAAALGKARRRTGLGRLIWTLVALVLLFLRRGRAPFPGGGRALALVVAVVSGVGLFFLPGLGSLGGASEVLATPLMDWGLFAFGPIRHANPLTWSAALPVLLALLLYHRKGLRPVLVGLAAGTAGFLLHGLFSGQTDVVFLPGHALDVIWLGVNAGVAFLLGWAMMRDTEVQA